ncbi:MAG: TonB-dependent receptor [Bacteroidales bacterium]|nr:MAG: TonB-dependent receptor [Bacteroidales bacterium]
MKKIVFLLLLQLMGVWLYAKPVESFATYQISGRITDENGSPLIGATVIIENSLQGSMSDLNGSYTMMKIKSGVYTISVSFIGYEKKSIEVNLEKDLVLDFTLKPSSIMGEEIVVNATRASTRMPIAQTNLSKEDIKKTNTGFDIPFLLEMIPSVVATSESGTGVGNTAFRIRGTDMSRINVTVNGIPINDAESQGVYWVNMPDFTNSVDNIQVQRGVGTSTNGSAAFGASVNFQTSTLAPEPFTKIDLLTGSFGTWKTSAIVGTGLINKQFSFEGRFSQLKSDGYIDRGSSDHRSMFLTGAWHTSKSLLRFNFIHGEEHTGITWTGTPGYMLDSIRTFNPEGIYKDAAGNTHYYKDQKDNYTQTHYQLMYSHQLASWLSFSTALHLTKGAGYYEEFKDGTKFSKYGIIDPVIGGVTFSKTDLIRQKWIDNDFYGTTLSLNYRQGIVDATFGGGWNKYDGDHFGRILWTEINGGIPKNYEWYNNNGVKTDFNFFGKSTVQITEQLNAYADLQYRTISYKLKGPDDDLANLDQSHVWAFFNPKFGSVFKITENQEVFASFGVGNREPSRADLKDAMKYGSNNTPRSEQLFDYEFGYTFKNPIFVIGLNLYYMDYKDQLVLTGKLSDVGYPLMTNVEKSYRAGVEVNVGVKPLSWLRWIVNTTISENRIKNFIEYVELYDNSTDWTPQEQKQTNLGNTPISFSPSFVGSSQISINPIRPLTLSLISKYVGDQYYDNTGSSERKLDGYFVNNIIVDYSLKMKGLKAISLQLAVNNVLNSLYLANAWVYRAQFANGDPEYREDGFFPQAGTNFMVKLGVEF